MTTPVESQNRSDAIVRKSYEPPELRTLGTVGELTLGTLVTAMPENGGSGTSQV